MITLPDTERAVLIRTDFDDDAAWTSIKADIFEPEDDSGLGMQADVVLLEDRAFAGCTVDELVAGRAAYSHEHLFVADREAMQTFRHPVLVSLEPERRTSFRAVPEAVMTIDANLFVDNLSFDELAESADEDGIFRDF